MTSTRTSPTLFRNLFQGREADDTRLQAALEQMPHATLLAAQRSGAIEAVNGKAAALTGWSREELLRRMLSEVISVSDAADRDDLHTLAAGLSRQLLDVPLRTHAGRTTLVDLRVSAFASASGEVYLLFQVPLAEERINAERQAAQQTQALDSLERLVQLLAEPTPDALERAVELVRLMLAADAAGLYHVAADQPSLRLHAFTGGPHAFPTLLGPSEAQYLRLPVRWAASQRPEGFLQQAARTAGWGHLLTQPVGLAPSLVGALCVAYRPGLPIPAEAARLLSIAASYVHTLTTLISRAAAYDRARDLAVRLTEQVSAIHAQIEEGVVVLSQDGVVEELNSAGARILGYRSADVTGLPFDDVLIGDGALTALIRQCLEPHGTGGERDGRLLRRHGDPFPANLHASPLGQGGCVITIRDLSAVADQERRIEQQDHLAFVGQASQSFAHEVRHPLQIISVGVQYLATMLPNPDEEMARTLTSIQAECTRLSDLMTGMLAWTKPVNAQLAPVAIDAVMERLLQRFRSKLERRNVRLVHSSAPDLPQVQADSRLMEQVFVNLLDNALQAMPAGGQLMVDLNSTLRPTGRVVEIRIGDTGPGISEEHKRRLFDPYFTTKADGNGLGLAICKRLITVHRGAIGVESFPGTGTIFTITLPAHDVDHPEVPPP